MEAAFAAKWALTPDFERAFQTFVDSTGDDQSHHWSLGRICTEHRRAYEVVSHDGSGGDRKTVATLAGRLRHHAKDRQALPAVGDWVVLRHVAERSTEGEASVGNAVAVIIHVLPRNTHVMRQAAGSSVEPHVLAANVDTMFVVTAPGADFSAPRIERYRRAIEGGGAAVVVVINKSDTVAASATDECRRRLPADLAVVSVSALAAQGLSALKPWLGPFQTVGLVGSSGVGKSTLVNALSRLSENGPDGVVMATGGVRETDGTGQHTTTRRQLVSLASGGVLVDTPGMRELQLWASDAPSPAVQSTDPVVALSKACRYRNCGHVDEPGCAVVAAVASGDLTRDQWAAHAQLQRELDYQRRRQDVSAARAEARKWKKMSKANKQRTKRR